jgi:thiamine pyrophosphokinase
MRAVLFANGSFSQYFSPDEDDIVIAADGGAHHCLALGLYPAFVIGDLDSLSENDLENLRRHGAQIVQFPTRKDYTDLELAISYAQDLGADEILILGALGSRWDQTLANLLLPAGFPSAKIRLVDGNQEFYYIRAGETACLSGRPGDTVSLIPLCGEAQGISTRNLEYPLENEPLQLGSTRGVSNVLTADHAQVTLGEGWLVCVIQHQTDRKNEEA